MRNNTRVAYEQYTARLQQLNNTSSASNTFSVDPTIQQTLENAIQESSEFLKKINVIGVTEQEGEKLRLGISAPVASRVDTTVKGRETRDLSALNAQRYRCEKTNFDTHIKYQTLDAWAKFPDFQARVASNIVQRQALDRIMIGLNGTSVAANSDFAKNPLLQDLNIGWLQHYREKAPQRVMDSGKESGKVIIGTDGDYLNIDAAVFDAVTLIDPWFQNDSQLVAIVGRTLLHDKYFPQVNQKQDAINTLASDIIISQKRIGGLQAATVPFFPDNAILITTFDNLSLYWQEGGRRRRVFDNATFDRIENYESSNDAYVVEDFGRGAMIENIELVAA